MFINITRKKVFESIYIISCILILFIIPYFFPPQTISLSASYNIGFNNKLGWVLLAVFCFFIIIYSLVFSKDKQLLEEVSFSNNFSFPNYLIVLEILTVFFGVLLWGLTVSEYGVNESSYQIPHLYDLSFGGKIYKDFEYCYGFLLLYIPYGIYYLGNSFLSIKDAYFISLIIEQCLGLYFFFIIISNIESKKYKLNIKSLTSLVAVFSFPISTGVNYTLFRFVLPFFIFYVIDVVCRRTNIWKLVMTFTGVFAVINTSTEFGLVLGLCVAVYYILKFILSKNIFFIVGLLFDFAAMLFCFILFPEMFGQVASFSSGALNWPFVPSLPVLSFFIATFLLSNIVGIQLHNIEKNLSILCFELIAFCCIPGALGRCDPGHIFFYGLFIFVLVIFYYSNKYHYKQKLAIFLFLNVMLIMFFSPYALLSYTSFFPREKIVSVMKNNAVFNRLVCYTYNVITKKSASQLQASIDRIVAYEKDKDGYFSKYDNLETVGFPYPVNPKTEFYIKKNEFKKNGELTSFYYRYVGYNGGKGAVEKHFDQLKRINYKYLLLPETWSDSESPIDDRRTICRLFCTYYMPELKNNCNILFKPMNDFIKENYHADKRLNEYILYVHN